MDATFEDELRELIEANRTRALWSLPRDFFPQTTEQTQRTLERARLLLHRLSL